MPEYHSNTNDDGESRPEEVDRRTVRAHIRPIEHRCVDERDESCIPTKPIRFRKFSRRDIDSRDFRAYAYAGQKSASPSRATPLCLPRSRAAACVSVGSAWKGPGRNLRSQRGALDWPKSTLRGYPSTLQTSPPSKMKLARPATMWSTTWAIEAATTPCRIVQLSRANSWV